MPARDRDPPAERPAAPADLSPAELRNLRLSRLALIALPTLAGLSLPAAWATAALADLHDRTGWRFATWLVSGCFGGVGAALSVVSLDPVERGKPVRTAVAALFGLAWTYAVAMLATCFLAEVGVRM